MNRARRACAAQARAQGAYCARGQMPWQAEVKPQRRCKSNPSGKGLQVLDGVSHGKSTVQACIGGGPLSANVGARLYEEASDPALAKADKGQHKWNAQGTTTLPPSSRPNLCQQRPRCTARPARFHVKALLCMCATTSCWRGGGTGCGPQRSGGAPASLGAGLRA